jgi:hypothetical protein
VPSPNIAHQITWILSTCGEIVLLGATIGLYTSPHHDDRRIASKRGKIRRSPDSWEATEIVIDTVRLIILLFLVTFYTIFSLEREWNTYPRRQRLRF